MCVHVRQVENAGIGSIGVGDRLAYEIATNPRSGRPEATRAAFAVRCGGATVMRWIVPASAMLLVAAIVFGVL